MEEPIAIRKRYYVEHLEQDSEFWRNGGVDFAQQVLLDPDEAHPANLVSSRCLDGMHRPALDIDIPAQLIPSSTEGHFHLYFPTVALDWEEYYALLVALERAGIIQPGFLRAAKVRGHTSLRPPGVKKVVAEEAA